MTPGRGPGEQGRAEQGAATVLVLAMAGLLCFIAVALVGVSGLVRAQRSAQSAADLAALAAASSVTRGADGCAEAAGVAEANGATLTSCSVSGLEARVEVEVVAYRWVGQRAILTAEARAGPS